jgi:four helix bundle protein
MRDHTKLEAFRLADQLTLLVYQITRQFPDDERFGLTSQMRRAAVSVAANIVEASARASERDYLRLLSIAYASAKELQYQISLSDRLHYMDESAAKTALRASTSTCRALAALIAGIKASRSRSVRSP